MTRSVTLYHGHANCDACGETHDRIIRAWYPGRLFGLYLCFRCIDVVSARKQEASK